MAGPSKQSRTEIDFPIDECRNLKKQRLMWFKNESGKGFWRKVPHHKSFPAQKRGRCTMCNVNNTHSKGSVNPAKKCDSSDVCHCLVSRHLRVSCWDGWHSSADIFHESIRCPLLAISCASNSWVYRPIRTRCLLTIVRRFSTACHFHDSELGSLSWNRVIQFYRIYAYLTSFSPFWLRKEH